MSMLDNANPEKAMRVFRLAVHAIGGTVVLSIAVSAALLAYAPAEAALATLDREIDDARKFLSHGERLREESDELHKHLAEMEEQFEAAVTRIPDAAGETEFLGQISELASRSGIEILDYRPGEVVERERYNEIQITVAAEASYVSLCRFLHGLKGLDRLCQIVTLNVTESSNTTGVYPVNMTVAVFFAPLEASDTEKDTNSASS